MSVAGSSNVAGAIIFFAYIVAAVVLCLFIVNSLIGINSRKSAALDIGRVSTAKLQKLIALAVLSFSVLSYHMLNFLILSYGDWTSTHQIEMSKTPISTHSIRDHWDSLQIWSWATSSTLFLDFAEVICNNPQRWLWTQSALLYSYAWNTYMAIKGHQLDVKHLWAYFLLAQILPVSYTQNLFLIATLLIEIPKPKQQRHAPGIAWQLVPLLAYFVCLTAAPYCVGTPWFFPVLFTTRVLLFSRLFELRPSTESPVSPGGVAGVPPTFPLFEDYKWTMVYFCLGAWVLSVIQLTKAMPFQSALTAVSFNPAVSALGYDLLIGIASLIIIAIS